MEACQHFRLGKTVCGNIIFKKKKGLIVYHWKVDVIVKLPLRSTCSDVNEKNFFNQYAF